MQCAFFDTLLHLLDRTSSQLRTLVSSRINCNVLLQLSPAVSACDLQRAGEFALQKAGGQMRAKITGQVERVGESSIRLLYTS